MHDVAATLQVQLGEVRVVLHLRDLHALERGAHSRDEPLAEVVGEWPRRLDAVHLHHDRLGLGLADPDRKHALPTFLLEDHDVGVGDAVQPELDDRHLDHAHHPTAGASVRFPCPRTRDTSAARR